MYRVDAIIKLKIAISKNTNWVDSLRKEADAIEQGIKVDQELLAKLEKEDIETLPEDHAYFIG